MKTLEDFKQEQMKDEDFKREYDEVMAELKAELKGESKQTDVSVDPYEMKYIRCGKGE